jgi:exopolysaccharide biosynthesis polyprenyl glycosylphosphotransferase
MIDKHDTVLRYRSSVGGSLAPEDGRHRPALLRGFRRRLIVTDGVVVVAVIMLGLLISSRQSAWAISPVLAVYGVPFAIWGLWWGLLAIRGSYDQRVIGLGTEEIRRIVSATLLLFAVVAGVSYLIRADISRAYAFVSLPVGLVVLVAGRFAWRGWLYRQRAQGRLMQRTVVVGSDPAASELVARLERDSYAGYSVVGRFGPPETEMQAWLGRLDILLETTDATAIALVPSEALTSDAIHELAWRLEGRDLDLLIAPGIMDITGPRLTVRPAAGLPLLHLDEAVLSRPQAFSKRVLDLVGSLLTSLLLLPVFAAIALAVRMSSKGPVIFRQTRIGVGGRPFTMLKFRTMVDGADAMRDELRTSSGTEGATFKMADDPRVTKVGRFLRRWSLDELPQLWNVIGGSMSLVGPRPHPLDDVDRYGVDAYRRLALKPGMTGLWQVEGRSDLTWQEALQFDLYYVETWTLSGDIVLLARTVRAVLQGRGAA